MLFKDFDTPNSACSQNSHWKESYLTDAYHETHFTVYHDIPLRTSSRASRAAYKFQVDSDLLLYTTKLVTLYLFHLWKQPTKRKDCLSQSLVFLHTVKAQLRVDEWDIAAATETSMEVPQETKNRTFRWSINSTSGYISKEKNTISSYMHSYVHGRISYDSQDREAT